VLGGTGKLTAMRALLHNRQFLLFISICAARDRWR
jgi:hypothetical protein